MFQGSMVAIVTPMHVDGAIDFERFENLIDWQLEQGTEGLIVLGTTGESVTIEKDEREELIRLAISKVNGRVPVIVGTGANATQHAIAFTEQALALKADAALLVTPYYNKPVQEGLFQHYRAVAKAVTIPQILYNVPGRTACDLLPETVLRLSAFSNIVGVKEATGDIDRLKALQALQTKMDFLSGDDFSAMEFMLQGGQGVISVVGNIAPKLLVNLCDASLKGDRVAAEKYNAQFQLLTGPMFIESNPIPTKWALEKMGFIQSGIRLPLTTLGDKHHLSVQDAMQSAGLL